MIVNRIPTAGTIRTGRTRRLSGLGDPGQYMVTGASYTFRFQNNGYGKPTDSMLTSALSGIPGLQSRGFSWVGGIAGTGYFGNTLVVNFQWNGGPQSPDVVGANIAQALTDGTFVGSFIYQSGAGTFATSANTQPSQPQPGTTTSTGFGSQQSPAPNSPGSLSSEALTWMVVGGFGLLGVVLALD